MHARALTRHGHAIRIDPNPPCATRANARGTDMNLNVSLAPLIALIAGILILLVPRLLNYIVALYLILVGVMGLLGIGSIHLR
jgi:hypothetical protein